MSHYAIFESESDEDVKIYFTPKDEFNKTEVEREAWCELFTKFIDSGFNAKIYKLSIVRPKCDGCFINHPSQKYHSGEDGCL